MEGPRAPNSLFVRASSRRVGTPTIAHSLVDARSRRRRRRGGITHLLQLRPSAWRRRVGDQHEREYDHDHDHDHDSPHDDDRPRSTPPDRHRARSGLVLADHTGPALERHRERFGRPRVERVLPPDRVPADEDGRAVRPGVGLRGSTCCLLSIGRPCVSPGAWSDASTAKLLSVNASASDAAYIPPGACENKIGYWHLPGVRFVYQVGGSVQSFAVASLISWRGEWYVVHLGPNPRSQNIGTVDQPAVGPGVAGPPGGC